MLDALALAVNRPMYLSLTERERTRAEEHDVRRVIEQGQIERAFLEAHNLKRGRPSFLRSLGWYRKGLTTDDPLDKFLAFWNAIESVASKYYRYVPSINQEKAKQSKGAGLGVLQGAVGPLRYVAYYPGPNEMD
jgi:hypothetical protein